MLINNKKSNQQLLDESLHNIERELKKEGRVSAPVVEVQRPNFNDVNYFYEGFQVKISQIEGEWIGLAYKKDKGREVTLKTDVKLYYENAGKEIKRYIDAYNKS